MVTLSELREIIKSRLDDHSEYLGVATKEIEKGEIGEDQSKAFNIRDSFIRFYMQQKTPTELHLAGRSQGKIGTLLCLVGKAGTDLTKTSEECFELAERVEAVLHEFGDIHREQEPIFAVKNSPGLSVFGVSFFFIYNSSAGEPWQNV